METAGRILILDDEPVVAHATALLVATLGYEAVECLAPTEAYNRLKNEAFDLLISDYRMPEMNGLELVSLLRDNRCTVPVMLMTAYAAYIDVAYARRIGISTILSKPFDIAQLDRALKPLVTDSQNRGAGTHKLAADLSDEWTNRHEEFPEE